MTEPFNGFAMLRPEKGSLAERSDLRGRVKHLCEKTKFLNGNLEIFTDDNIVTAPRNVSIKLSPLDVSICSTTSGKTTRTNSSPTRPNGSQLSSLPRSHNDYITDHLTFPKSQANTWNSEIRSSTKKVPLNVNINGYPSDYETPSFNKETFRENLRRPLTFQREVGKPLKAALDHICQSTQYIESFRREPNRFNDNQIFDSDFEVSLVDSYSVIDVYFREIVQFLSSNNEIGLLGMEDFELLCEAIGIPSVSGTFSKSEIEWWQQLNNGTRPTFNSGRSSDRSTSPSLADSKGKFLFTLGPRPFWEIWPACKRRKGLTNDEFKHILVERWRKHFRRDKKTPTNTSKAFDSIGKQRPLRVNFHHINPNVEESSKDSCLSGNKIMKRFASVARRYISVSQIANHICPGRRMFRKGDSSDTIKSSSRKENPLNEPKVNQNSFMEAEVYRQRNEIKYLKSVIAELKSSLQLSDAQNLAMEVYIKKISQSSMKLPENSKEELIPIRSDGISPTDQLESLVNELKVISQTIYPSSTALMTTTPTTEQKDYSKPPFYRKAAQNRCNNLNNNHSTNSFEQKSNDSEMNLSNLLQILKSQEIKDSERIEQNRKDLQYISFFNKDFKRGGAFIK